MGDTKQKEIEKEKKKQMELIEKEKKDQMKLMETRRAWREYGERDFGHTIYHVGTGGGTRLLYYRICRLEELLGIGDYEMLEEDRELREKIRKTLSL